MENYMMWQDWVAMIAVFVLVYCAGRVYVITKIAAASLAAGSGSKYSLTVEVFAVAIASLVIYWHMFII